MRFLSKNEPFGVKICGESEFDIYQIPRIQQKLCIDAKIRKMFVTWIQSLVIVEIFFWLPQNFWLNQVTSTLKRKAKSAKLHNLKILNKAARVPASFLRKKPRPANWIIPQCLFSSKIGQNRPFLNDFFIEIWPFLAKIFNFRIIFCLKTLVYSTKFFITYRRMEKTNDFIHYKCIYCLNQFFINKI